MIKAINSVSNTSFKGNEVKKQEVQEKTPEQIKDGKKKLALAAASVAVIAIAGIAITAKIKSGKPVDLSEIKFDKGIAKKGDELFTGTIKHANKAGNFELKYKKGKLISSTKTGSGNFVKNYKYNKDGSLKQIIRTGQGDNGLLETVTSTFDRATNKLKDGTEQKMHRMVQTTKTPSNKEITKVSLINKGNDATATFLYDGKDKAKILNSQATQPVEMSVDEEMKSKILDNATKPLKELLGANNKPFT